MCPLVVLKGGVHPPKYVEMIGHALRYASQWVMMAMVMVIVMVEGDSDDGGNDNDDTDGDGDGDSYG